MDNALTLTNDMKLVLGLVGFTMAMFLFERIRADLVALVVLVVLGISGLVAPEEIFSGFSGNAGMGFRATILLTSFRKEWTRHADGSSPCMLSVPWSKALWLSKT